MTVSKVVAVVFLTAGNGWAVASFTKKYGMGCKSCHSFGSELNSLGLTFKKNGYSFGEKSVPHPEKIQKGEPRVVKGPETSADNLDKPGPHSPEGMEDSPADAELPDTEEPLPETKIYKWESSDGTPHYSDTPFVNQQPEIKTVPEKMHQKSSRTGSRQLTATVPKQVPRTNTKTAVPEPEKTVLLPDELSEQPETPIVEKTAAYQPKNYEDCMAKFFIAHPLPESPEAAMAQFREAESVCVHYQKAPKR